MQHETDFGSFTVKRTIEASVSRVFEAFASSSQKEKWFKGPDSETGSHKMDFRPGGRERNYGIFHDRVEHRFEALYYDIVQNERIIYTYEMYLGGKRISVSLATITFQPDKDKTILILREDGVFLDGLDKAGLREKGTHALLDLLADSL